jgi:hypothetical protein
MAFDKGPLVNYHAMITHIDGPNLIFLAKCPFGRVRSTFVVEVDQIQIQ